MYRCARCRWVRNDSPGGIFLHWIQKGDFRSHESSKWSQKWHQNSRHRNVFGFELNIYNILPKFHDENVRLTLSFFLQGLRVLGLSGLVRTVSGLAISPPVAIKTFLFSQNHCFRVIIGTFHQILDVLQNCRVLTLTLAWKQNSKEFKGFDEIP